MKAELNDKLVADLKPPAKGRYVVWDQHEKSARGFGCYVTSNGVKSFFLAYRVRGGDKAGKERYVALGRAGVKELSVSRARKIARDMRDRIAGGYDPL